MRDRNQLSYQQFNIQLVKEISLNLQKFGTRRNTFSHELSLEFRPDKLHSSPRISYPRNFRLLRCLCIVQWYFPENLHFLTLTDLEKESFSWLNLKQKMEISIYLNSRETMIKYLYLTDRYSGNQIFGNILKNDLQELSKKFKVTYESYPRPRRKVYRRGPKDKGSRRVHSCGPLFLEDIQRDVFLQLEEEKFQRKLILQQNLINSLLKFLENFQFN